jgi:hypothetical protein
MKRDLFMACIRLWMLKDYNSVRLLAIRRLQMPQDLANEKVGDWLLNNMPNKKSLDDADIFLD